MTTISSANVVQKPDTLIDPNFTLPLGVSGVRYASIESREPQVTEDENGTTVTVLYDELVVASMPMSVAAIELPPPATVTIFSQSVHVATDGRFAVDVVLDVEDILGVRDFQVRVAKA